MLAKLLVCLIFVIAIISSGNVALTDFEFMKQSLAIDEKTDISTLQKQYDTDLSNNNLIRYKRLMKSPTSGMSITSEVYWVVSVLLLDTWADKLEITPPIRFKQAFSTGIKMNKDNFKISILAAYMDAKKRMRYCNVEMIDTKPTSSLEAAVRLVDANCSKTNPRTSVDFKILVTLERGNV